VGGEGVRWIRGTPGCTLCGGFDFDFDFEYLLYCSIYIISQVLFSVK